MGRSSVTGEKEQKSQVREVKEGENSRRGSMAAKAAARSNKGKVSAGSGKRESQVTSDRMVSGEEEGSQTAEG